MIMFGYKLKLVKKKDLQEYEVFEKAVHAIHQQTDEFGQWLYDGFNLNKETIHQLTIDIEGLHTFIDIYFNNKYSSPTSTMLMFSKIDLIRKTGAQLIDLISKVVKLDEMKAVLDKERPDEYDNEETKQEYESTIEAVVNKVKELTRVILIALREINLTIESDLIKIILGVDIMEEYKHRCKRLPKNKDLSTDFFVHFKAISKDDRKFLEKEKIKNER